MFVGQPHLDKLSTRHIERVDGGVALGARSDHLLSDAKSVESLAPQLFALHCHVGVHLFEIIVHLADGTAGQAVVELVEQKRLPNRIDLFLGILVVGSLDGGERGDPLELLHERLEAAVPLLDGAMRRVHAAMEFEVDLAGPGREATAVVCRLSNVLEEVLGGAADVDTGHVFEAVVIGSTGASQALQHDFSRTTATIAEAVQHKGVRLHPEVLVVLGRRARSPRPSTWSRSC
ncbi:hypothetical protein L1887_48045 [Cichorium endivia]|nr:hypothetical protein L1887_48045 [Cichorium endivia]